MDPTESVVEIIEVIDYTPFFVEIREILNMCAEASTLISGFLLFFVVVILCYFVYKFFRIFF